MEADDGSEMDSDEMLKTESLDEWLDGWEAAVEAGQSSISRQEAEKRYYKRYPQREERG